MTKWPETKLLPYKASWIPAKKVLVISPHPDDETLACGGTLCRYVKEGSEVYVVVMTDGAGLAKNRSQATAMALQRENECKQAMRIIGIPENFLFFWKLADRKLKVSPDLLNRLEELVWKLQPDICFIPSPYEHHPDHIAVSHLFIHLIPLINWKIKIAFFEIQPLPKVNFLIDISYYIEQKSKALDVYESQMSLRNYKEMLLGLNRFRTWSLPPETKAAEAFSLFSYDELKGVACSCLDQQKHLFVHEVIHEKVSVIIRTHNRPGALIQAIESAASQTWRNIEIIVVNDGKGNAAYSGQLNVPIFFVSTKEKTGRSHAANMGMKHASGEMVLFLDDDDLLTPFHVESLMIALHNAPWCSIAYSGAILQEDLKREKFLPIKKFSLRALFKENLLPIHCALVKKEAIDGVNGFDESLDLFEDWDLWLRLAIAGYEFVSVKAWTAIYRKHQWGIISKNPFGSEKDIIARHKVVAKHESEIRNHLKTLGVKGKICLTLRKFIFKIAKDLLC